MEASERGSYRHALASWRWKVIGPKAPTDPVQAFPLVVGRDRSHEQEGHDSLFVQKVIRGRVKGPLPYWGSRWALHVLGWNPWEAPKQQVVRRKKTP